MQACVTLNHAYHGQHHLNIRRPYYQLDLAKGCLPLPASYPVMFVVALFPAFFTYVMQCRLATWTNNYDMRETLWHNTDCIGVVRIAEALRKKPVVQHNHLAEDAFKDFATASSATGDKSSRNISGDSSMSG